MFLNLRRLGNRVVRRPPVCFFATATETKISDLLTVSLQATSVKVTDTSGGCGSMYDIVVESPLFKGKSRVGQHKLVTGALKAEIREMHGLTIKTTVPV